MQDTSQIANYAELLTAEHIVETKIAINNVEYNESVLLSVSTTGGLFADSVPMVGSCVSGEIDLSLLMPQESIPRMAVIKPYIRLVGHVIGCVAGLAVAGISVVGTESGDKYSGWLQKGVYFIDTRSVTANDDGVDVLSVHGFDAMLKAEAPYPADTTTYPQSDIYVVNTIAHAMGINVDARTTAMMNKNYQINLPATYTMREVLGNIASMYAGNFIISDVGELRLVGLTDIGVDTRLLTDEQGNHITFGTDEIVRIKL